MSDMYVMEKAEMVRLMDVASTAAVEAGAVIMEVYAGDDLGVRKKPDDSPVTMADLRADAIIAERLGETGLPLLSEEGRFIPFGERKDWRIFWLVDPLDGTKEFINRNGEFTVNIALVRDGKPVAGVVYAPEIDVLYTGMVGVGAWRVDGASGHVGMPLPESAVALPCISRDSYGIAASRSSPDELTSAFIEEFCRVYRDTRIIIRGSSLKLCMLAEGEADLYPRFRDISEWDTAAGHAIVLASGGRVVEALRTGMELSYNKEPCRNPWFMAFRDQGLLEAVKGLIPSRHP